MYLDYRKVFDSVPHRRLNEKLSFGINGKLLQWLDNFITSRSVKVGLSLGNFTQYCRY